MQWGGGVRNKQEDVKTHGHAVRYVEDVECSEKAFTVVLWLLRCAAVNSQ